MCHAGDDDPRTQIQAAGSIVGRLRAGQVLRGSSEFHASGDSNLYLRRHGDRLTLSVEHRAAASISIIALHLDTTDDAVALATIEREPGAFLKPPATNVSVEQRILDHLAAATDPLSAPALRKLCQVRNTTMQAVIAALVADGRVPMSATRSRADSRVPFPDA